VGKVIERDDDPQWRKLQRHQLPIVSGFMKTDNKYVSIKNNKMRVK
jgi:hypothetical protein